MQRDDKNSKGLDTETKLRLLITLINDEGKEKLPNNLEKLTNRINEFKDSYFETIIDIFIKTITQVPLKTGIYAYCLFKIYKLSYDRVFIEEIFSGVLKKLKDSNFSDEMIPKRIIRFIYESYKYGLINKEILEKFDKRIFNFNENENDDIYQFNLAYLFTSNFPYIYNSLSSECKEEYLMKLINAKNLIKNNISKSQMEKYRNKGDFYHLEIMVENYIALANENKLHSDLILDIKDIISSEEELENFDDKEDGEFTRNLNNLYASLNHIFDSDMPRVLILNNCKFSIITNPYFDLSVELETKNPTILNENIFMNDLDKILLREIIEEVFSAFQKDLSVAYVTYLTKISSFYSFKKNLDFSIIIHLINLVIRYDSDNLKVLEAANITNRFLLVSSNFSNAKFNSWIFKEICYLLINKYIPENALVSNSVEYFSNFLGFIISNQEFNFAYENINSDNSQPSSKIVLFKKSLVDRLCALGTQTKIVGFLTDDLKIYLPQENKPYWKFSPNEPFYYDTDVINDNIQYKKEFSSWSEKFESTGSDFIYILFSCLFYTKSKTLSHLRESLLFYRDAIAHYNTNSENQNTLLNALFDVWGHSDTYLKFLIEFLLNQNIIDHLILVKFIFQKLKDLIIPEFQEQSIHAFEFSMSKNYSMFNFIDSIIIHCHKSLNRLKNELVKEQGILAISDETIQTGIIKSIEFLEENIEKNILANDVIHFETLRLYLDLYFTLRSDNDSFTASLEEEKNFLFDKIVLFMLKYKDKLSSFIVKVKEIYNKKEKRIDELFDNFVYMH